MTHRYEPRDPVRVLHAELEQLPAPAGQRKPSGIALAAALIGRSPNVLYNKFSEEMGMYAINVQEGVALGHVVADRLGTYGFAEAVAEQFRGVFVPLPDAGEAGQDDILQAHLAVIEQLGELSRELMAARADGVVDEAEFARLKVRGSHGIQAIHHLLQEIETTVRPVDEGGALRAVK